MVLYSKRVGRTLRQLWQIALDWSPWRISVNDWRARSIMVETRKMYTDEYELIDEIQLDLPLLANVSVDNEA
jgi:hypothetical protein